MGRKTRIDKQMILHAAYELLDEGGIEAVAIKSVAAKLQCSTQPVSWHFGSMTELKKELYFYAGEKMFKDLPAKMENKPAIEAFFISGIYYISLACDHPNVFRFLNVDSTEKTVGERLTGPGSIFDLQFDKHAYEIIAGEYKIPEDKLKCAVRDIVIYTHGLAVMMMFDNFKMPKKQALKMVFDMGKQILGNIGIDLTNKAFELLIDTDNP